jgi:hypothetical protein
MKDPTSSTHPNPVCLSVRTYFSISSEMAGRIGLKFGETAQKVWQSVFHEKKIEKTKFENLLIFLSLLSIFFFFFFKSIFGTTLPFETTLSPCHTPQKRDVWVLGAIFCFEFGSALHTIPLTYLHV